MVDRRYWRDFWRAEREEQGRSVRPTPCLNNVSPVKSRPTSPRLRGVVAKQQEPGVWPGVWRIWRNISPKERIWPSVINWSIGGGFRIIDRRLWIVGLEDQYEFDLYIFW